MTNPTFIAKPAAKPAAVDWQHLDVEALPEDLRTKYDAWTEAQKMANEFKAAFIDEMREACEQKPGLQLQIAYNFGKLSYAYLPPRSKSKTNLVSFSAIARK